MFEPAQVKSAYPNDLLIKPLEYVDVPILDAVKANSFVSRYVAEGLYLKIPPHPTVLSEVAAECLLKAYADCEIFVRMNIGILVRVAPIYPVSDGQNVLTCLGRDFWQARHGTRQGFSCKGLGESGILLDQQAALMGRVVLLHRREDNETAAPG